MDSIEPFDTFVQPRRPSRQVVVAAVIGVIVIGLAIAWVVSPYLALASLREAAKRGDPAVLAQKIDFPVLRASLKTQLTSALTRRLQSDPRTRSSPLAQLGAMMLPSLSEGVVDALVTPASIAALANGGPQAVQAPAVGGPSASAPGPASPAADHRVPVYTQAYVTVNLFRATIRATPESDPVAFWFERRGLYDWKLIDIVLPPAALQGLPSLG